MKIKIINNKPEFSASSINIDSNYTIKNHLDTYAVSINFPLYENNKKQISKKIKKYKKLNRQRQKIAKRISRINK